MLGEVAAEAISVAMLALVLGFAVMRPWGWGEAVAAVPAAILVIAVGAISPHRALVEAERLGPIIGFLAERTTLPAALTSISLLATVAAAVAVLARHAADPA